MAIKVYTVLSEFKFDVGHAITSTDALQSRVDQLSNSASQAKNTLSGLGIGFMQNLSGYSAGLLGVLGSAIKSSEKFTNSQLSFTNVIDANIDHLSGTIGTLNEKMAVSKAIMNDIAKDSRMFGVPADQLKEMTEGLSAILVPKGLAGDNLSNARTMSRNLLKSAPNLGLDPNLVQGQLIRAISGDASMADTLFRRLLAEAPEAFKAEKVSNSKDFNALFRTDPKKTFDILNNALAKFSSNAQLLEMRANTFTGAMQRMRDLFTSFDSVLRPLGDVLIPFIVKVMNIGIEWLNTKGRVLINMMANFMSQFLEDPKKVLHEVDAMSDLGGNFKLAGKLSMITFALGHLVHAFGIIAKIPIIGPIFTGMMSMIPKGLGIIGSGIGMFGSLILKLVPYLWPLLKLLVFGLAESAVGLMAFLIPLQGLSKAISRMKVETLEWFATKSVEIAEIIESLTISFHKFSAPILDMIDGWEQLFFSIIGGTGVLDGLLSITQSVTELIGKMADAFHELYAGFTGIIAGTAAFISTLLSNIGMIWSNFRSGNFKDMMSVMDNPFDSFFEAGSNQFQKTLDRALSPTSEGGVDGSKVSNHQHNYDVKMTNNFKEVLQPDRIAFTIQEQLMKASANRTQGQASTLSKGLAL